MPIITPDLSQFDNTIWDEGYYRGKILSHEAGNSKTKGTPQLKLQVEVTNAEGKTQTLPCWVPVAGKGVFVYERLLRACGFTDQANAIMHGEAQPFDTDQLNGQELNVKLVQDEYNGRPQNQIESSAFLPL